MEKTANNEPSTSDLPNPLASALARRHPVFGFWHVLRDMAATEALQGVAADFVIMDMQHWTVTFEDVARAIVTLRQSQLAVVVRVAENNPSLIGKALDVGADGVIVPMINTPDDAMAAVAAALYPPAGTRSWGPRRMPRFKNANDYRRDANGNAVVIVQIETAEAVNAAADIADVPGLGAMAIGPTDLAISLGYSDDLMNPEVGAAARRVRGACESRGVPFGYLARSRAEAGQWLAEGAALVACESDVAFIADGSRVLVETLESARKTALDRAKEDGEKHDSP
ncbi:aldolase/citrate lyase family protein [Dactylosporangium sp. NPDC051484]|uniref:HpcH/HpaI aldolase family protein n=1 Tax=Dactylosporangium sp. NPDC051484 TaxID=3154942 RepID=UPI00344C063E